MEEKEPEATSEVRPAKAARWVTFIRIIAAVLLAIVSLAAIAGVWISRRGHFVSISQPAANAHNDWNAGQVAQSFTIPTDQTIIGAQVLTQVRGDGARRFRLNLCPSREGDVPGSEVLAVGTTLPERESQKFAWRTVYFETPYRARAGERLCIVPAHVERVQPHAWHEMAFTFTAGKTDGRMWRMHKGKKEGTSDLAFAILARPHSLAGYWSAVTSNRLWQAPVVFRPSEPEAMRPTPTPLPPPLPIAPTTRKENEKRWKVLYSRPVNGESASMNRILVMGLDRPLEETTPLPLIQVRDAKSGSFVDGRMQLLSDRRTLVFIPDRPWTPDRLFDFTLSDLPSSGGHYVPFSAYFRADDMGDNNHSPLLERSLPAEGYIAVSPTASIVIYWADPLAEKSLEGAFVLRDSQGHEIATETLYEPFWYQTSIRPKTPLLRGQEYEMTVSRRVSNLRGVPMEFDVSWKFETLPEELQPIPGCPYVLETSPGHLYRDVARDWPIRITWSEPMAPESITEGNVRLFNARDVKDRSFKISYDAATRVMEIRPAETLDWTTPYRVKISDKVRSATGAPFGWADRWQLDFDTVEKASPVDGRDPLGYELLGSGGPIKPRE